MAPKITANHTRGSSALPPALSVVLATDSYDTIRESVSHLRRQTAADRIELVIAAPQPESLGIPDDALAGFGSVRTVAADPSRSLPAAQVVAVRAASAPAVAFAETHSFPEPEWAAALIDAHREPHAAVGTAFANFNPGSGISWANFLFDFGRWVEPFPPQGEQDLLPSHNTSYKRDALTGYGQELEPMLAAETLLQWDLVSKGHTLHLEPAAKVRHMNMTRLGPSLAVHMLQSRTFAALRARRWSLPRRLLYACGSPLVAPIRARQALREVRRAGAQLARVVAPTVALAMASAVGELMGYATLRSGMTPRYASYELHRERY